MNLAKTAIERPIWVAVSVVLIFLLGLLSIRGLPVQLFPDIDRPHLNITVDWRSASPQEMESEITDPIEQEMQGVQGLKSLSSNSYAIAQVPDDGVRIDGTSIDLGLALLQTLQVLGVRGWSLAMERLLVAAGRDRWQLTEINVIPLTRAHLLLDSIAQSHQSLTKLFRAHLGMASQSACDWTFAWDPLSS